MGVNESALKLLIVYRYCIQAHVCTYACSRRPHWTLQQIISAEQLAVIGSLLLLAIARRLKVLSNLSRDVRLNSITMTAESPERCV